MASKTGSLLTALLNVMCLYCLRHHVLELAVQSFSPQLKLQWQTLRRAPVGMWRGAAVTHHNTIYCISGLYGSNTVYRYELGQDEWQEYLNCPYSNPGLAIINGLLTAIGGEQRTEKTNKLVSWRDEQWKEIFPPMIAARSNHAVVGDGRYVVAINGEYGETSIELFTVHSTTWCMVTHLPQPLPIITATLCEDSLYTMDYNGHTYSISLSHLTRDGSRELSQPTWQPLPHDAPFKGSTLCTVSGEVVAVGGLRGSTDTGDFYQLYRGEWVKIGCMDTARYWPIVAVLPGDRMVVVGGCSSLSFSLTAVELVVLC